METREIRDPISALLPYDGSDRSVHPATPISDEVGKTEGRNGYLCAMKRSIEILAPASSLKGGRVALSAGADAVYIGAPKFGARAAAGVSLEDIATLTREAHEVGARVYVALNTILTDCLLYTSDAADEAGMV